MVALISAVFILPLSLFSVPFIECTQRQAAARVAKKGNAIMLLIQKIEQLVEKLAKTKLKVSKMRLGP